MVNKTTLSVKQINALQPLEPPTSLLPPPHSVDQVCSSTLPSSYSLWPIRVFVHASLMAMVNQTVIICLYLPHSSPFLTPPISLTCRQSLLSVALLSPYCQASGGSHLKITRPGHTQPSLNACQFTHGKGITRLLLGSCKLLLMAMQIIRVRLAPPANLFFMWVHS